MIRKIIKNLIPPLFPNLYYYWRNKKYGWHGNYKSWEKALESTSSYSSDEIFETVTSSARKVHNGEYPYERDGIVFNQIQYSWPLLSGLLLSSSINKDLKVLDFGGGLASTFYQNQFFLKRLQSYTWSVVEQDRFATIGRQEFNREFLSFYNDIDECLRVEEPNTLVLSSVLQYLEKPFDILDQLLSSSFSIIIIDRTPITQTAADQIKVQTVPPEIYQASYPCWFFSEKKLYSYLQRKGYLLIEQFETLPCAPFKGAIFERCYEK